MLIIINGKKVKRLSSRIAFKIFFQFKNTKYLSIYLCLKMFLLPKAIYRFSVIYRVSRNNKERKAGTKRAQTSWFHLNSRKTKLEKSKNCFLRSGWGWRAEVNWEGPQGNLRRRLKCSVSCLWRWWHCCTHLSKLILVHTPKICAFLSQ